jgi:hypothetical protein
MNSKLEKVKDFWTFGDLVQHLTTNKNKVRNTKNDFKT